MSSVMPVSDWIAGGIRVPGFTSVDHSAMLRPRSISTRPTSVMRSYTALAPVVSRSRMTRGWSSTGQSPGWVADRPRDLLGGLAHLGSPCLVEPVGGRRHGEAGDEAALVVVD